MLAACHPREEERLRALRRYDILDTPEEQEFNDIVALIADICEAPVAVINLIDADRQWFKAEVGLGVRSTPLETSLCSHVILEKEFVEIGDTLADPRMSDNPLCVADGGFRFYAGALLTSDDGLPIGTLCVLDNRPRSLTDLQRRSIQLMSRRVMSELNLRVALKQARVLRREIDHRVKNSLASVAAIVGLQSMRSDHPSTREALDAVQSRISALEALHDELQQGTEQDRVDIARLIKRSTDKLATLFEHKVAITVAVEQHLLESNEANAVALTINEFVTNSAKHAFPDGRKGSIRIDGRREAGGYRLVCADDGQGDPDTIARIGESRGLGARIIRTLAESVGAKTRWSAGNPGVQLEWVGPALDTSSSD